MEICSRARPSMPLRINRLPPFLYNITRSARVLKPEPSYIVSDSERTLKGIIIIIIIWRFV
jgi:hypothetical protein